MTGIIENLPDTEYHARPEVSKHDLDMIRRAPLLYQYRKSKPEPPNEEMNFGSLVHLALLQPHLLDSSVAFLPEEHPDRPLPAHHKMRSEGRKLTDSAKERFVFWDQWNAENEGKQIVTPAMMEKVLGIQDSIMKNPATRQFFTMDSLREPSLFFEMEGVKCRARLDMLGDGIIADLKTTGDASANGFAKDIARYSYHRQGAMYIDGAKICGRPAKRFVLIAVETTAPHLCTFHTLGQTSIDCGRVDNKRGLATYRKCLESGIWPNMSAPFEGEEIECPLYAL